jgi:hypothetical protein
MTESAFPVDELRALADRACNDALTEPDIAQLERLLRGNAKAQQFYLRRVCLDRWLRWEFARRVQQPTPPGSPALSPRLLDGLWRGSVGYSSSGWPVAYLLATVILGMGLLIGSLVPAFRPQQIAKQSVPLPSPLASRPSVVGRITGMVDCVWQPGAEVRGQGPGEAVSKSPNLQLSKSTVALGDKLALVSGLLEITYDTGAKVILQGPVTYDVESHSGGFLSVGRLTARVETKGEGGRRKAEEQSEISNLKSEIFNPQSLIPNPSLSTLHSPLFTIKTPTAIVTDLGTEFAVEVDKQGSTTSHVFRGSVRLQSLGARAEKNDGVIVLHENEAARTERTAGDVSVAMRRVEIDSHTFVRRLAQAPKPLDLLDIVAGGYGTVGRRERGINPANGMEEAVVYAGEYRPSDGVYRPIVWHKLIDGVFAFSRGAEPMVLDSDGHTFEFLPRTATTAWTAGSIWARAAQIAPENRSNEWVYTMGEGKRYMPERRGLLCMCANAGITFNLNAMRATYPGTRPARLRAMIGAVGNPTQEGLADVWVFVDGRVKLRRTPLRDRDGAVPVRVEIGPNDRFLTLVVAATPAYHNPSKAVVFGDPVLDRVVEQSSDRVRRGSNTIDFDLPERR